MSKWGFNGLNAYVKVNTVFCLKSKNYKGKTVFGRVTVKTCYAKSINEMLASNTNRNEHGNQKRNQSLLKMSTRVERAVP